MNKSCPICLRSTNDPVCVICKLDPTKNNQVREIMANQPRKKNKKSNPGYVCIEGCGTAVEGSGLKCENCQPEPFMKTALEAFKVRPNKNKEDKAMSRKKECITNGCKRPAQKDGLCYKCYKEKHGKSPYSGMDQISSDKGPDSIKKHRTCEVKGCDKFIVKERRCTRHFNEKHGIVSRGSGRRRKEKEKPKRHYKKRAVSGIPPIKVPMPEVSKPTVVKPGLIEIRDNLVDSIEIIKNELKKIEELI